MIDHDWLRVCAYLFALALPSMLAAPAVGATRVEGGRAVSTVEAPWSVMIAITTDEGPREWCSGSLIAASTVLTAAHCMKLTRERYRVYAGGRRVPSARPFGTLFAQIRSIREVREHPGYREIPTGSVDDVALLELAAPFDVSGVRVRPIAVADTPVAPAAELRFYGFGKPFDGQHLAYRLGLAPRGRQVPFTKLRQLAELCSTASAVFRCGDSLEGAMCPGDSGGGLVTAQRPPTLVGVATASNGCERGKAGGFAEVTAPEIRNWIAGIPRRRSPHGGSAPSRDSSPAGSPSPRPSAPRCLVGRSDVHVHVHGRDLAHVLQSSASPTYLPTRVDAGRRLDYTITAANAGGVAQSAPANALRVPRAWGLKAIGRKITIRRFESLQSGRRAALTVTDFNGEPKDGPRCGRAVRCRARSGNSRSGPTTCAFS